METQYVIPIIYRSTMLLMYTIQLYSNVFGPTWTKHSTLLTSRHDTYIDIARTRIVCMKMGWAFVITEHCIQCHLCIAFNNTT